MQTSIIRLRNVAIATACAGALFALVPFIADAAYNDVSLTTDTVISLNGLSYTVSGATAEVQSIVVNAGSFDVTMLPNSSLAITSPDKKTLTLNNPNQITYSFTCDSSSSTLSITSVPSTRLLTITPGDTCSSSVAASTPASSSGGGGGGGIIWQSSGGGGGGGGGGTTTTTTTSGSNSTTVTTTTTGHPSGLSSSQVAAIVSLLQSFGADAATIANVQASLNGAAPASPGVCSFTRDLTLGSKGADVMCLQNTLIAGGYSIPAGATGYFGVQTQAAVAAWQKAKGITPTAGYFGAKSRAAFGH